MFFGSIPALVTPFAAGRVDLALFRDFVEWQIDQGSNGLVPCGTTGEAATLTTDEHRELVAATVEVARGRVPVIAGCGSNNTAHAIELTRNAKEAGADAALHVPPYYNRPNQDGIYVHLAAVADLDIPILLYNVPSRTITDIAVETMARLSRLPNVVGVKDATGNLGRVTAQRLACGKQFVQLSGNDETALGYNAMGGVGCISVTANVAPRLCASFPEAMRGPLGRSAGPPGPSVSAPHRHVHRRLAGSGQICAVEGAALPRRPARADDRAVGRIQSRGRFGACPRGPRLAQAVRLGPRHGQATSVRL